AVADDEVQRRALGNVRPDPRRRRPGGLVASTQSKRSAERSDRRPLGAADFRRMGRAQRYPSVPETCVTGIDGYRFAPPILRIDPYFGISPNVLPTGSTACRIRRESSTAAWRCFTA